MFLEDKLQCKKVRQDLVTAVQQSQENIYEYDKGPTPALVKGWKKPVEVGWYGSIQTRRFANNAAVNGLWVSKLMNLPDSERGHKTGGVVSLHATVNDGEAKLWGEPKPYRVCLVESKILEKVYTKAALREEEDNIWNCLAGGFICDTVAKTIADNNGVIINATTTTGDFPRHLPQIAMLPAKRA
jgi:hypothetical protein